MFRFHGYSGPCPKPPLPTAPAQTPEPDAEPVAWQLMSHNGPASWIRINPPIDNVEEWRPLYAHPAPAQTPMSEEQKQAVLARDLNRCIAAGGNIYFLAKIGATDGKSFQQMAGSMTGMTEEEYRAMMIGGGRSVEGNRKLGEDGTAQPHRQPQGQHSALGGKKD